jgi:hypothetical protein
VRVAGSFVALDIWNMVSTALSGDEWRFPKR